MTPVTTPRAEGQSRAQPAMLVFVLAFLIALGVALVVGLLLFDVPAPPRLDVRHVPCAWVAALPWLVYGAAALAVVAALRQIGRSVRGTERRGGWRTAWLVAQGVAAAAVSWWIASVINPIVLTLLTRIAGCAA